MADLDPANLHKLRVVDLKEILVKKGLSTSGLKAELVKRLRDALLNESPETQTEGQSPDADENLDKAYDNPSQSSDLADEEMMQKRSWRQEGHEEPMDIDDDQQADSNQQELEDAAGRRMAEEHQRRMAEERQKRLAEAEEQKRIEEERQREEQQKFEEEKQKKQKMLEENQNEEQIRMEEERRGAEQMRIEEEKQREEQMRVQEEERRREEQMRKEEERRREEQIRIEEERQREEQKRVEEERQKEKQRRMEEERRREEQRRVEEERRREEQRRMDEERRREEQRRMEEERRREEQRRMEEERRREEQRRVEELRQKEEQRRMEEQRRKEELRRIEEERRKEEQRLYAEEEKRKEECRLYLEEERRKEEQRLHAEEERRKEEQKKLQEAEIAKQQLAHQQKLLAEKEKIRLAEEQQRLLAEEQKRLMAEEQQRLLTEQQRLMAEEQQRLLVEEQQRILAEQQKLLAEQQQKRLAEQQQKLLIEQQQKFLGEQQQKMLAHQLTPPGLLPTSMPPPPPLQQFTQPPPAPPTSIVTTAIANAFPPPPPPALNNQTPSKEPDAAEKLSDKNEIQISDKDSISEQSEEIKLPHAVEKILALKNERAQQLGIDPDSVIETAVELKESTTKKTVSRGLVSIDENEDEELEEEETNNKVKESRRRRKKKKKQKRSTRVQRPNEDTTKTETVKEKDVDVDIEYVQDVLDPSDPLYSQFIKIFEKFKLSDSDKDKANADASMEEVKQEPKLVDKKKPMDLDDDDDDDDDDERDEKKEEDKPKLSKRKLKKLSRMTVAELKQKVSRPELVEMHDVTAKDPVLLLHLKASRNTVPVPRHWCFKRKYLQGKRGIEKPAFELPDFIKRTGIMEMRQALQEKEDQKTMKAKMRERVRPKLGKIDIDYQKLHDAFFKWQTKPKMTIHGDLYYEGKEFETRLKEKKPGDLNDDLRIALGMPTGPNANKCPPPWLIAMQRYGPPPSYPNLKIPGLNAPIPDACSFGYHAGGWGKPPVDEQGRPLYGDVFGTLNADDQPHIAEEEIDHTKWGELESESSEEEEEDEDEDEEEEEQKGEDETGLVTPAEGLITPSGFSSIPAGMETPDMIELRKRKIEAEMEGGETPALYTILPEKKSEKVGASMMGSTHIYDLAAAIPAAKIKAPGTTSVPPQGIEVALDPSELEMDTAAMAARYEQTMREQQSQLEKEDLSDMVAEHAARQKTKRKKLQQDSGKAPKKYKEFKF